MKKTKVKTKPKTRKEKIEILRNELSRLINGGESAHDKFMVNGICRYPRCRCNNRAVFSRHRH